MLKLKGLDKTVSFMFHCKPGKEWLLKYYLPLQKIKFYLFSSCTQIHLRRLEELNPIEIKVKDVHD